MSKTKTWADEVLESLELKGLVEKNGTFRTSRNGEVQPVWEITPLGKWLSDNDQLNNYVSTWESDLKS